MKVEGGVVGPSGGGREWGRGNVRRPTCHFGLCAVPPPFMTQGTLPSA